jgi:hypothetical protein
MIKNTKRLIMITSNINSILATLNTATNSEIPNNEESFKSNLTPNQQKITSEKTNAFTFENIKGITLEEIDTLFKNEDDKNMAKNLRLATLFTHDEYLAKALFNTVLGEPFNVGYSYLTNRYEDKSIFLNSTSSDNLFDLLQESMHLKSNNNTAKPSEVIPQEKLDKILSSVNSFNFLSAFSHNSKRGYDKYKDEKNDYAFLYNDYHLKYQELMYKYQELESKNKTLMKQF